MNTPNSQGGLEKLRAPFPPHLISKLPKPTKQQTEEVRANYKAGIRCEICGTWHHPKVVHLDYVGHAALTDRLLDVDQFWSWEPVDWENGSPKLDKDGGMWIRLTVCGVTRLGYGDAQGKTGGDAMKERIGDALRNAAMRFGAALDLWHKGDLHAPDELAPETPKPSPPDRESAKPQKLAETFNKIKWMNDFDQYREVNQLKQAVVRCKAEAVAAKAPGSFKQLQEYAAQIAEIIKADNQEALDLIVDQWRSAGIDKSTQHRLCAVASQRFTRKAA